jgi:GTP-binding protein Era
MQNSMMNFVKEALDDADILIYMISIGETKIKDESLFKKIQNSKLPVVVLINKIDSKEKIVKKLIKWQNEVREIDYFFLEVIYVILYLKYHYLKLLLLFLCFALI